MIQPRIYWMQFYICKQIRAGDEYLYIRMDIYMGLASSLDYKQTSMQFTSMPSSSVPDFHISGMSIPRVLGVFSMESWASHRD